MLGSLVLSGELGSSINSPSGSYAADQLPVRKSRVKSGVMIGGVCRVLDPFLYAIVAGAAGRSSWSDNGVGDAVMILSKTVLLYVGWRPSLS